jgi:hypothetical protein
VIPTIPIIDQVFLVYRDGCLISYAFINMDDDFHEDIVGGKLVSVMKFISFAFVETDEEKTNTDDYKSVFGNRGLLLEMGDNLLIAIVVLCTVYDSLLSDLKYECKKKSSHQSEETSVQKENE